MFSKLTSIAALFYAAQAAVVDPTRHTVQYQVSPGQVITEHYEEIPSGSVQIMTGHGDVSSNRHYNDEMHVSDYRYRCNYECRDSNNNLLKGLQQGIPNQACIFTSCYDCDWTGRDCSYCRLTPNHNYRDIGGLSSWCYNSGGHVMAHNCDYSDGEQC